MRMTNGTEMRHGCRAFLPTGVAPSARHSLMNGHLKALTRPHYNVRLLHLGVTKALSLIDKLGMRVLLCEKAVMDGSVMDWLMRFNDLTKALMGTSA